MNGVELPVMDHPVLLAYVRLTNRTSKDKAKQEQRVALLMQIHGWLNDCGEFFC